MWQDLSIRGYEEELAIGRLIDEPGYYQQHETRSVKFTPHRRKFKKSKERRRRKQRRQARGHSSITIDKRFRNYSQSRFENVVYQGIGCTCHCASYQRLEPESRPIPELVFQLNAQQSSSGEELRRKFVPLEASTPAPILELTSQVETYEDEYNIEEEEEIIEEGGTIEQPLMYFFPTPSPEIDQTTETPLPTSSDPFYDFFRREMKRSVNLLVGYSLGQGRATSVEDMYRYIARYFFYLGFPHERWQY